MSTPEVARSRDGEQTPGRRRRACRTGLVGYPSAEAAVQLGGPARRPAAVHTELRGPGDRARGPPFGAEALRRGAAPALAALGRGPRRDRRAQRLSRPGRRHRHEPLSHDRGRPSRRSAPDARRRDDAGRLRSVRAGARRPARRPRQLRGDPLPAHPRRRREGSPTPTPARRELVRLALRDAATPAAPRWPAGRGHHPVGRRRRGRRRGRRRPRRRPGRGRPRGRRRCPRRRSRARPTSSRRCAAPASSTPAGAGSSCCSTPAGRRHRRRRCSGRRAAEARPAALPRRRRACRRGGPAFEVMYLLEAPTRTSPPSGRARRRSATRCSSSAATGCGTCTCTSTTSAPRSRPGSAPAGRTGSP